jgi:hypothetical protein
MDEDQPAAGIAEGLRTVIDVELGGGLPAGR